MKLEAKRAASSGLGTAWALVLVAAASGGCAAHLPGARERVAFLERSTISIATDRSQAYEVDPAIHLMLWNGLESGSALEEGGFATAGSLSFLGAFRMERGDSAPIRTPTYEPRAKLPLEGWVLPCASSTLPQAATSRLGPLRRAMRQPQSSGVTLSTECQRPRSRSSTPPGRLRRRCTASVQAV